MSYDDDYPVRFFLLTGINIGRLLYLTGWKTCQDAIKYCHITW